METHAIQTPSPLREELQGLQRTLQDHALRFDQLALQKIAGVQEKLNEIERGYQQAEITNKELKGAVNRLGAEVGKRQQTIHDLQNQLAQRVTQVMKAGGDVEKMKMEIAQKEASIRELQARLAESREALKQFSGMQLDGYPAEAVWLPRT